MKYSIVLYLGQPICGRCSCKILKLSANDEGVFFISCLLVTDSTYAWRVTLK